MIPEVIQKEKRFLNSDHMGEYAEVGDLRIHYVEQGGGEASVWRSIIACCALRRS